MTHRVRIAYVLEVEIDTIPDVANEEITPATHSSPEEVHVPEKVPTYAEALEYVEAHLGDLLPGDLGPHSQGEAVHVWDQINLPEGGEIVEDVQKESGK